MRKNDAGFDGQDICIQDKLIEPRLKILGQSDYLAWGQQLHFIGNRRD